MNPVLFIRQLFYWFNDALHDSSEHHPFLMPVYNKLALPLLTGIYKAGDYKIVYGFKKEVDEAFERYLAPEERNNLSLRKKLTDDILRAHFVDRMTAEEYFLYDFRGKDDEERSKWLSDINRKRVLMRKSGNAVYQELVDKTVFYGMTKKFFCREVMVLNEQFQFEDFLAFAKRHRRYILKPYRGTLGRRTFIAEDTDEQEVRQLYDRLLKEDNWIVEELVIQHPATAAWNPSSVNTVRVPSFRTKSGVRILQPFFRTGRKGSVVDNAGLGGVFAVFDPDSGIITTDGVDEHGGRYPQHPDSGITFKGWQIPQWEELKALVAEVHHSLPSYHRYVGFDFALTEHGWVLIEGNWGQMVGQMAELKGIRREFITYLG